MKKTQILIGMLVALGIIFYGGSSYGAEGNEKAKGCAEVQSLKAKIKEKKEERKALKDKIKAVRGEKANKGKKDGKKKGEKDKLTDEQKAAKLEKLKAKNPELYKLITEKIQLRKDIKDLKDELKTVKAACKGKK